MTMIQFYYVNKSNLVINLEFKQLVSIYHKRNTISFRPNLVFDKLPDVLKLGRAFSLQRIYILRAVWCYIIYI